MKRRHEDIEPSQTISHKYEDMKEIGSGAYGTVYRGRNKINNTYVALKQIRIALNGEGIPPNTVREIALLKHLSNYGHPNIVQILDVCHGRRLERELNMYIVFEHMEEDLASFLERSSSTGGPTAVQQKQMAKDIVSGVEFLHSHRIVHRDLKPQNLLVTKTGTIKLADFGLAKIYDYDMTLTAVVVTLWYRAPEVLLNLPYATPVDMWSVGCIIAELYTLRALFPGKTELAQLREIFRVIGAPNREDWNDQLPIKLESLVDHNKVDLRDLILGMSNDGFDLIEQMLQFNPAKRVSASEALNHPYFRSS